VRQQEIERRNRELERRQREIAAQVEILQAQLASEEAEVALLNREGVAREGQLAAERVVMGVSRQTGAGPDKPGPKPANKPK
jgi:circadian clock protein KaiC